MPPRLLHPFAQPSSEHFVELVRGQGAVVYDVSGKAYIDAMASLWYCNVGHGRAEIAEAVAQQLSTLAAYSVFAPFTTGPAETFAARVCELAPLADPKVFLCQSGSEAIDTALKLARLHMTRRGRPDKTVIVARDRGYHGTNFGGTSAQGIDQNRQGWGPLVPDIVHTDADDVEQLARVVAERSDDVAAVLVEPVQGAGGVWPPEPGYLQAVRRVCDQHGALLIFDEVITGFGRLGNWFGAQRFAVKPDIIAFAKGVTSGYQPLGGVLLAEHVWEPFMDDSFVLRHGYTYSGHAAACVAALVNLDIIEREGLLAAADRIADRLGGGLAALAHDGTVAATRGVGGMWAVTVQDRHDAAAVRDRMLSNGVIVRAIGDRHITVCPPLITTDDELDRIVDALADCVR